MSDAPRNAGFACIVGGGIMFFGGAILAGYEVPSPISHDIFAPYFLQGMIILLSGLALSVVGIVLLATFRGQAVAPRTYRRFRVGGTACLVIGPLLIAFGAYNFFYNYLVCYVDYCYRWYPYQQGGLWTSVLGGTMLIPGIIFLATSATAPPSGQRPQYATPSRAPSPPRPRLSRARRFAIAVVLVAMVIAIAVPLALRAVATPTVEVTDATYNEGGCTSGPPYVEVNVTLTNSGDADGFAQVSFYQDNTRLGARIWDVPRHDLVNGSWTYFISNCGGHTYAYVLDSVMKA